jgi:monoamine oxidase
VASTYSEILRLLEQPSKDEGILRFSTPVTSISVRSDHIKVESTTFSVVADAVIVTAPLGCLQKDSITFDPPLPSRVQSAILNLGFGNLEKLFLKFDCAWWINGGRIQEPPPDMYTFLPPLTLPASSPKQLLTIFSLASLPVNSQPVLVVYLAGAWSTYMLSQSEASIIELFESHYLPFMPNYTNSHRIKDLFCTNWTNDEYSNGSYTHIPVGSVDGVDDLRVLGTKILDLSGGRGGLWFAGEHAGTADMGTVNGAMASGVNAAYEVLKALGDY